MSGKRMPWFISFVLAFGYLGRIVVIALPHEVVALPGTTDALNLRLFVTKSEAHRSRSVRIDGAHGVRNPWISLAL